MKGLWLLLAAFPAHAAITIEASLPQAFPGETIALRWTATGIVSGSCRREGDWATDGDWLADTGEAEIQRVVGEPGETRQFGVSCQKPTATQDRETASVDVAIVKKTNGGETGIFDLGCDFTGQTGRIDPIVAPGVDPFGHQHDFYGMTDIQPDDTGPKLLQRVRENPTATNCSEQGHNAEDRQPVANGTSIWSPSVYVNGTRIKPGKLHIYYRSDQDAAITEMFPRGFQLIAGSPVISREDAKALKRVTWFCGDDDAKNMTVDKLPKDCGPHINPKGEAVPGANGIHAMVDFPSCWNGVPVATDHHSHMAYMIAGHCPKTHPHLLPHLVGIFSYPVSDTLKQRMKATDVITVGDGKMGMWQMHADYMFGWEPFRLTQLLHQCQNAEKNCKSHPPE